MPNGQQAAMAASIRRSASGKPGTRLAKSLRIKRLATKAATRVRTSRFEFYKILPGNQEATPAAKTDPKAGAEPSISKRGLPETSRRRQPEGKVGVMGIEASVQEADIPEKARCFVFGSGRFRVPTK